MKVAIMLTGLSRTFEKTYDSFFELMDINEFDYDIYIHTWDIKGNVNKDKLSSNKIEGIPWSDEKTFLKVSDLEKVYKPKKIIVEKWEDWKNDNVDLFKSWVNKHKYHNSEQHAVASLLAHHYKINQCFKLIEQSGIKYDMVFKIRMDIDFRSPSIIEFDGDSIYFDHYFIDNNVSHVIGVQDTWVYSNYTNMKKYSNIYNYLLEIDPLTLSVTKGNTRFGWQYIPEIIVLDYIKNMGLTEKIFPLGEKVIR